MGKLYSKGKDIFFRDSRKEMLLYLVLWLLLFLTPVLSIYMRLSQMPTGTSFPWDELLMIWRHYTIFLAMFLVHNFLLAPLLVYRQRRTVYFSSLAVMVGLFLVLQCSTRPDKPSGPFAPDEGFADFDGRPPLDFDDHEGPTPPVRGEKDFGRRPGRPPLQSRPPEGAFRRGPIIFGEHEVVATIIFILMLGMNVGVKLYFRQRKDHERMLQLEHDNLEQQLEYLKYQINPHFLMNTLNNIHALVDIDPEQAKVTIVELSKIMRFVLYEGNKQKVALRQELLFLENYIELMKMRFTDHVAINVSLPEMIPDREIPPLLLITFVENAFKHGVSYQQQSFVSIEISIAQGEEESKDGCSLHFKCMNSKKAKTDGAASGAGHGVGLQNARRRLDLLYGNSYTLDISDAAETYIVTLQLPL